MPVGCLADTTSQGMHAWRPHIATLVDADVQTVLWMLFKWSPRRQRRLSRTPERWYSSGRPYKYEHVRGAVATARCRADATDAI
jgi:hypothetical protein